MTRDGLIPELFALLCILQRGVVTGHGCSDCSPTDAVAGLAETHERRLQAVGLRQEICRWDAHILQGKARSDRCAKRPLAVHIMRGESWAIGLDKKATDAPIFWSNAWLFELRPDHCDVSNAPGGDPHLFTVENVMLAVPAGSGSHSSGVGTEVRFSETEAAKLLPCGHLWQPQIF